MCVDAKVPRPEGTRVVNSYGGPSGPFFLSRFDDGYGLGLVEPGRTSADHLVRRIVGQRVPQWRPGGPRGRFVRLYGHRYPGDGQHVLLTVRAHERLDDSATAVAVRRGGDVPADAAAAHGAGPAGRATALHFASFLHHGVQVAGRVRPALAPQRVAPAARRQRRRHRAAAGVRARRQVNACKTRPTVTLWTFVRAGSFFYRDRGFRFFTGSGTRTLSGTS